MKGKNFAAAIPLCLLLVGAAIGLAQQAPAPGKAPAAQGHSTPGMTMGKGMPGMMEMMGQMKAQHQEMTDLMKKATQGMTAMQGEKDAAAMKSRMAEHGAMMEQMRGKMAQHGEMMQRMSGMMSGMMDAGKKAGPVAKPPTTAPAEDGDHTQHHP